MNVRGGFETLLRENLHLYSRREICTNLRDSAEGIACAAQLVPSLVTSWLVEISRTVAAVVAAIADVAATSMRALECPETPVIRRHSA